MTPLTQSEIAKLREVVAGMTPGDVIVTGATIVSSRNGTICSCGRPRASRFAKYEEARAYDDDFMEAAANATGIAALVNNASALLDAAEAEAELREACKAAQAWMLDPDDPHQWERIADEFHRATGFLRPGKDEPMDAPSDQNERNAAWRDWCQQRSADVRAALRKALERT